MILLNIFEIFQNHGAIITILVLSIIVSYIVIRNSLKRNEEQQKKIDILYDKLEKVMTKFKSDSSEELAGKFVNYAESANKIQIQIYHMLRIFNAERVSIYEFHNGGKNLSGIEFKKCSNTYEAVSLSTKPIMKEMQNLPLSLNPLWNKLLATKENIDIPNVDDLEDTFLKSYLKNQNIQTLHAILLEDYANIPIGFITLEYYSYSKELTQDELGDFYDISIKISVLINLK